MNMDTATDTVAQRLSRHLRHPESKSTTDLTEQDADFLIQLFTTLKTQRCLISHKEGVTILAALLAPVVCNEMAPLRMDARLPAIILPRKLVKEVNAFRHVFRGSWLMMPFVVLASEELDLKEICSLRPNFIISTNHKGPTEPVLSQYMESHPETRLVLAPFSFPHLEDALHV